MWYSPRKGVLRGRGMKLRTLALVLFVLPQPGSAVTIHDSRAFRHAVAENALTHVFGGVGEVSDRNGTCTGTPLTRRVVLTAAHCITTRRGRAEFSIPLEDGRAIHRTGQGRRFPGYDHRLDPFQQLRIPDAAILRLDRRLPRRVTTYAVVDAPQPPVGHPVEFVGFGMTGRGLSGALPSFFGNPDVKWFARNELERVSRSGVFFSADFDDGRTGLLARNRFGSTGLGAMEGMIAPGDSGGPAFYRQRLAKWVLKNNDPSLRFGRLSNQPLIMGVASYTADAFGGWESNYGTVGSWTWSGAFADWIREIVPDASVIGDAVICPRGSTCGNQLTTATVAALGASGPGRAALARTSPAPVPLDGSLAFLAGAVGALALLGRRRRSPGRGARIAAACPGENRSGWPGRPR